MIGESPLKQGPDGGIPPNLMKVVCGAFESYVQICQVNCQPRELTNMGKKVEDKRQKWMEIKSKGTGPPQYEKWTEADEEELSRLKSSEVSIADTAVGRERENCRRLFMASFKSMSEEEKRKCMEELNAELNNDENNDST